MIKWFGYRRGYRAGYEAGYATAMRLRARAEEAARLMRTQPSAESAAWERRVRAARAECRSEQLQSNSQDPHDTRGQGTCVTRGHYH